MRPIRTQLLFAVAISLSLSATMPLLYAQKADSVEIIRLYTGADGLSHFQKIEAPMTEEGGTMSPAMKMGDAFVVREQPGHVEDWHNADARRYVIPISGRAEVEVTGGEKMAVEPGAIWLAEDLTGKGHIFRVVGNEAWVAMFVNFAK